VRVPTFIHTRFALGLFDRGQEYRDAMLQAAETTAAVMTWASAEVEAAERVRVAFYMDTRDRNRLDTVRFMAVGDIRRIIQFHREKVAA
jgi:hypothetical protein